MRKKGVLLIVLSLVLSAIVWGGFLSFHQKLNYHLEQDVSNRLEEIVSATTVSLNMQVDEQIQKVDFLSNFLAGFRGLSSSGQMASLQTAMESNGIYDCAVLSPSGAFLVQDGFSQSSARGEEYFEAAMQGRLYISDPYPSEADPSQYVILFAGPVMQDGKVTGVVAYTYPCGNLERLMNLNILEGEGQVFMAKQNGQVLLSSGQSSLAGANLLQSWQAACAHMGHTAETCMVVLEESGSFTFTPLNTQDTLYLRYKKLPFNDWYLFAMVPANAASQSIQAITAEQRFFGLSIALCVLVFFLVAVTLYFTQRHNMDKMTGAMTPERFRRSARRLLRRSSGEQFVLIKLDIRNFKLINRAYSYTEGDRVIRNTAEALRLTLNGKRTLLARAGADDFLFLIPYGGAARLEEQRRQFIATFRRLMGPEFTTTVEFPTGQYILTSKDYAIPDITELMEKVNFAHRAAKHQREYNNIVDYVDEIEQEALMSKSVEDRMSGALDAGQFQLYLQPKYRLSDERVCGAEALVRWALEDFQFMYPTDFIPVLERNGFIVKLDKYMFRQAAIKLRKMMDDGEDVVPISVNFSRSHLMNDFFVDELCQIADEYSVPHELLEVELTESAVFENVDQISRLIVQLHEAGFTMSMDDFGSGYSCLALLKDLPVDILKIDKGFFGQNADAGRSRVVVASVLRMAQDLHITTVAEGIETAEQVQMLRELGCDIVQGYYYAKPMPGSEFHLKN